LKRSAFDSVSQGVLIGDEAMGTMLYQHGVFLNRCFDELSLTDPKLVKKVTAATSRPSRFSRD
jgi:homocysteine S-methyltransferase